MGEHPCRHYPRDFQSVPTAAVLRGITKPAVLLDRGINRQGGATVTSEVSFRYVVELVVRELPPENCFPKRKSLVFLGYSNVDHLQSGREARKSPTANAQIVSECKMLLKEAVPKCTASPHDKLRASAAAAGAAAATD
eukprot:5901412-Pyramimonas_sp.AAC.1